MGNLTRAAYANSAYDALVKIRYTNSKAFSRAIALRFVGEFVVIGAIMATMAFLALMAVVFSKDKPQMDEPEQRACETNGQTAVKCKNVSDSAGEWLTP